MFEMRHTYVRYIRPTSDTYVIQIHVRAHMQLISVSFVAGVYFACVMIMCTISVITTVVVLNFHHRTPDMYEMPIWVSNLWHSNSVTCMRDFL